MTLTPTVPSKQLNYQEKQIHLQADSKPLGNIPNGTSKGTTNWFASDLVPIDLADGEIGRIRIWITIATEGIVKYTVDGTFFKGVNGGVVLAADSEFAFDTRVTKDSLFNIKFDTLSAADVECHVDQVNTE